MAEQPFYVTSFKGVGVITRRELAGRFGISKSQVATACVRDYDITRFAKDGPGGLGALRTSEDVFYELGESELAGVKADSG